ncbi:MAG: YitT family protein, partial [Oscillospiraceae bacterium]
MLKKQKNPSVTMIIDILLTILGSGLLALGIHSFTAPNRIAPGGVTGIATIINHITGVPIGALTLAINIPLIIIGFVFLGKKFMTRTIVSIISFTIFIDYLFIKVPTYQGDMLLAGIFGGAIMGIGMGIMFVRSSSSGGMDIVNRIIHKKIPHVKLGVIIFISDVIVASISAIAFKSFEAAMIAMITLFVSSKAIDAAVYGLST